MMKRTTAKSHRAARPTLGDLISTVSQLAHNERLSAYIVADMINSHRVRLDGDYIGRRVVVG
jgi:hypothetical protein